MTRIRILVNLVEDADVITVSDFAKNLRYQLRAKNISQRDLADRCDITEVSVSRYMRGSRFPKMDTMQKICKVLNCSSDALLGLKPCGYDEKLHTLLSTIDNCWKCQPEEMSERELLMRIMLAYKELVIELDDLYK